MQIHSHNKPLLCCFFPTESSLNKRLIVTVRSASYDSHNSSLFIATHSVNHRETPQIWGENNENIRRKNQSIIPQSTPHKITHCGWNLTLESVVHGILLIVWSLYAEQKMNAVMLIEDVKVALRPKVGENSIIGRVEIAKVVKGLMEGEEGKQVQTRMRDLKDAAEWVLSADGSSTRSLAELAQK